MLSVNRVAGGKNPPGGGWADGCDPRFDGPWAIAIDSRDNVWVADTFNYVVRKISPDGVALTVAGTPDVAGDADGIGTAAKFYALQGITVDAGGTAYVTDTAVSKIKKISPDGAVQTILTGVGAYGIAINPAGTLYFTNGHAIYRRTPDGVTSLVAGDVNSSGYADGTGAAARFYSPGHIALDATGNIYVADQTHQYLRKVTPDGVVTTVASYASLGYPPMGVAVAPSGNIFVSAGRVYEYTPGGVQVATYGLLPAGGSSNPEFWRDGAVNEVRVDGSLAIDSSGRVYVADRADSRVRRIIDGRLSTFAGSRKLYYNIITGPLFQDHGPCTTRFTLSETDTTVMAVASDPVTGSVYVADHERVTRVQRNGAFTTILTSDGINGVLAATTDVSGNLYVLTWTTALWKIAPDGTITGLGNGYRGGDLAVDTLGNVYVTDRVYSVIWKVTQQPFSANVFAGTYSAGGPDDGLPGTGKFQNPVGLDIDAAGNLYVADTGNGMVRKVTPNGFITTLAGTFASFAITDGDRNTARFKSLGDLEYDPVSNNLYVAENGYWSAPDSAYTTSLIRRVTQAGDVLTVAGTAGATGGYADGTGSDVRFSGTLTLSADTNGRLYIGDVGNTTVRVGFVSAAGGQTVGFSTSAFSAPEASRKVPMVVTRSGSSGDLIVDLALSSGAATTPADYFKETTKLTFFAGQTSTTYDVRVFDDSSDETDEWVFATLSNPTGGASVGSPATASAAIIDDDGPPSISVSDVFVNEGDAGSAAAMFSVYLSRSSSQNVFVTYTTGGGTAQAGSDYVSESATLTFAPGEIVKVVTIDVNGDVLDENDETFNVTLSSPVNGALGDGTGVGTIRDDDGSRVVAFQSASYSVSEGTNATITVVRSGDLLGTVTVDYATAPGSAGTGSDFAGTSGSLTFLEGETSKSFDVVIFNDVGAEGDETFTVSLSNPTGGAVVGNPATTTVTITAQGASGTIQFSPASYTVSVSAEGVSLTVVRTGDTSSSASVNWTTSDLTAHAGRDYVAASGTVNFASGETSKGIGIVIPDDRIPESREKFRVTLSGASGATLGAQTIATVTLLDDDPFANTDHDGLFATAHADFNNDGRSDVLWRNETIGRHLIWYMNGTTVVSGSAYIDIDPGFRMAGVADFNHDGRADIVWYDGHAGVTDIWTMNGSTRLGSTPYYTMALPWEVVGVGDFNNDTNPDILWRNGDTGVNLIWYLSGTNVVSGSAYFTVDPSFWLQGIDDFNNDGYADLVWQNHSGLFDIWLMQGHTMIGHQDYGFGGGWIVVAVNDFNADGTPDLLLRNLTSGQNLIWYMNGAQVMQGSAYFGVDPSFRLEATGDFNGDYKADLAWRATTGSPTIDFWLMDGQTLLGSRAYESFDASWRVVAPR
jgi:hypothetical protein